MSDDIDPKSLDAATNSLEAASKAIENHLSEALKQRLPAGVIFDSANCMVSYIAGKISVTFNAVCSHVAQPEVKA